MLTKEQNETLVRIGPGTTMGQLMRRYWLPVCLTSELEVNGDPKRVRLLGEDLVAFRDGKGHIGLLDELCPHRRASLMLARNENDALECIYHGWKIDCAGRILDTPVEPENSTFKDRIRATAYSTYESGGVVWAYMGPPELEPPHVDFFFTHVAAERVMIVRTVNRYNWAQGIEGVIDSSHTNFLHKDNYSPAALTDGVTIQTDNFTALRPSRDTRPYYEVQDTDYGFRYAAVRKPIVDPEMQKYVRVTLYIAPVYVMFPPPKGWVWLQAFVPIDDEYTTFWFFQVSESAISTELRASLLEGQRMRPGLDLDENFRLKGTRDNNWLQDRSAMRRGETHTGIKGVNHEDIAVQESMGPVLDRTHERLGVSDTAVIHFRRMMIEAAQRVAREGAIPPGLDQTVPYHDLRAEERTLPITEDWRVVGAFGGETVPA
jgi:phthalate 4,5-dioxygenase